MGPGSKLTNASKNNRGLEGRNEECLLERRFLSFQSPLAISPVPNQSIQGLLKLSFIRVGAAGPNPQGSNTETKGEVPSKPIIRLQRSSAPSGCISFIQSFLPSEGSTLASAKVRLLDLKTGITLKTGRGEEVVKAGSSETARSKGEESDNPY